MFVVHTTVPLDPASKDDAVELVEELTAAVRDIPGVVRYRPAVSLGDDCVLQFFEQYEDAAAVEAKEQLPEYEAFAVALPELTDGQLETVQAELDEAPAAVQFDAEDAVPE